MGVTFCERAGCDNYALNRHIANYGNLCDNCFDDFVKYNPKTHNEIITFMATNKNILEHIMLIVKPTEE